MGGVPTPEHASHQNLMSTVEVVSQGLFLTHPILEAIVWVSIYVLHLWLCDVNMTIDYLVEIGFQKSTHIGFEMSQVTEEICALIFASPSDFVNRRLEDTFRNINLSSITATITPTPVTGTNAAMGKFHFYFVEEHL